jgi:hypothetical protein
VQQPGRERQPEERLEELELADGGDPAQRQAAVPERT